ncbi:hypothetical protein KUCAC02_014146 [Chaenocephalus aceratus]|uniref:Uncharacterized protein n=1 Tax=Chaenocephalus aceratus TaxID=36190 RepID=A0ACB9WDU4_CHAAC|nr:hypothetical protein KUCAC02_014146 [Chaenocephalus aceratus]
MSSYKHKSGATKRKEKDKKENQGKAKLSKLDGYFFRPTPPPAGDEPEVVATASRVSSLSPSPPTMLVGVSQIYSDDDNRDDSAAAASCSSKGEPGLMLDQPHPSPSGSLPAAPQGEEVLGMKAATGLLLTLRLRVKLRPRIMIDRAKKLDIQRIVDEFAERKARRVPFK